MENEMVIGFMVVMALAIGFVVGHYATKGQHVLVYRKRGLQNAVIFVKRSGLCDLHIGNEMVWVDQDFSQVMKQLINWGY
jgi:hypothetical protein